MTWLWLNSIPGDLALAELYTGWLGYILGYLSLAELYIVPSWTVYPVGQSTDWSFLTGIIAYNYEVFCPTGPTFGTYICHWLPYTSAKFQLNRSMHSRGFCDCAKRRKKMNKNCHFYLGNSWCDLLQFWNVVPLLGSHFHSKFGVLQIKDDRSTMNAWKLLLCYSC